MAKKNLPIKFSFKWERESEWGEKDIKGDRGQDLDKER